MAFDPASIARRQRERARQRKRQKKLELKQQRRDEKAAKGEEDEGGPQIDWGDAVREGELPSATLPKEMAEDVATPEDVPSATMTPEVMTPKAMTPDDGAAEESPAEDPVTT